MFNNMEFKPWLKNYFKWVTIIIFPLFMIARLACAVDFLPFAFFKNEFHKKIQWSEDISALAGDRPVVFTNSYQRPSVYTFYTGRFAHTLDNWVYRKTQYDLWDFEEKVHGKEILYVPHFFDAYYKSHLTKKILTDGDSIFVRIYKDFQSLQRECVILKAANYTFSRTDTNSIHLEIYNPYPYRINFRHEELPVIFQVAFMKNGYMEVKKNLDLPAGISGMNIGDTLSVDCKFTLEDLPAGVYKVGICTETGLLYDTFNSRFKDAKVNE
jgi:hypothetical protein